MAGQVNMKRLEVQLRDAAMNNDSKRIQELLDQGVNINCVGDLFSRTPLHSAAWHNSDKALTILIEHGADINFQDKDGRTPLHRAALYNSDKALTILIEHGADINFQDKYGTTPLHLTVVKDNVKAMESLLEYNANTNIQDNNGETPLHLAVKTDKVKAILTLMKYKAKTDILDKNGQTPLHVAIRLEKTEAMGSLITHGANVDSQDNNGETPLHLTVKKDKLGAILTLLQYKAKTNILDNNGQTPLHVAIGLKKTEAMVSLITHGANVDSQDNNGQTPLHVAIGLKKTEAMVSLITHGANVDSQDNNGQTPLHVAIGLKKTEAMVSLITHGANVDSQDNNGETPLHLAVKTDKVKAIFTLLKYKAKTDILDNNGSSPIEHCKSAGAVILLKINGASVPTHKSEDLDKLAGFKVSSMEHALAYHQTELDESELQTKLKALPKDFECEAFCVHSNKLISVPNLRKIPQMTNLKALIIMGDLIKTLEGLPDNVKYIYCRSDIEVMAQDCFMGEGVCQVIQKAAKDVYGRKTPIYLHSMIQPPIEIIRRGQKDVLQYYMRHKVVHSRIRTAFVGETTAGKTSLVQSLIKGSPNLTDLADRTQVVDIKEWHISESQIMMMVDQGGHPIYQICNPYFITDRSTLLITHKLSDPAMTNRTKQVFRHILHQHQANEQVHFVLTHKDELTQDQSLDPHVGIQTSINQLLANEISNMERLKNSPNCPNKENLNVLLKNYRKKQKSMKYFLVSNKTYDGVKDLQEFLISNISKQEVSIPENWINFYSHLNKSNEKYFTRLDILQILRQNDFDNDESSYGASNSDDNGDRVDKVGRVGSRDNNNTEDNSNRGDNGCNDEGFSDGMLTCLHYFVDTGLLLWNENHDLLQNYFFHDLEFLIKLFKALFNHDLKASLNYEHNRSVQAHFGERELERTLKQYEQHGLIKHKLLSFLWQQYDLDIEGETIFIHLIKRFHIFSEIHSELNDLTKQLYFVPWLVKENKPLEFLNIDQPLIFTNDTFTLALQCLFHNHIPLNVVEMFFVQLQKYATENKYIGKRYAWADGLQVKVGPKEIISFKDTNKASMFLLVKCKTESLEDAWSSFSTLYRSLQSILKNYPGVVRSLHTICGHCVLNRIDQPYTWLPEDVFPNEPSNNKYATCEEDEDSEIPAALISHPAAEQIPFQIEAINTYLQKYHQQGPKLSYNTDGESRNSNLGTGSHESRDTTGVIIEETRKTEGGTDPSLQVKVPGVNVQVSEIQQQLLQSLQSFLGSLTGSKDSYNTGGGPGIPHPGAGSHEGIHHESRETSGVAIERSHRSILESPDASCLQLQCQDPVLSKTQKLLEENMNPNSELIDKLIKFGVMKDRNTITYDRSVDGKVKKIIVLVDRSKKIEVFIEALNDCYVRGPNCQLAAIVKRAYDEYHQSGSRDYCNTDSESSISHPGTRSHESRETAGVDVERSHRSILESPDASCLQLQCQDPVLTKTQKLLEENMNPNSELIDKLVKFSVIKYKNTITYDRSLEGKVKKILVLVDRDKKIEEFIGALKDCNVNGANYQLAVIVKQAYDEFLNT